MTSISLTSTDRSQTYGDCYDQHSCFGELVQVYRRWRERSPHSRCPAHEAAVLHMLSKLSRICYGAHHRDNYVDLAAYAAIAFECEERHRQTPNEVARGGVVQSTELGGPLWPTT